MAHTSIHCVVAASFLAVVATAYADILHVANNGVDSASCGATATPCRSITQAISNAVAGDHIIAGPGSYRGESGAPGCDCFVAINKSITLTSSDGAASTVIDGRGFEVKSNVLVIADGVVFGLPGGGFTVTNPKADGASGITIDGKRVKIEGNQVIADSSVASPGVGILAVQSNPGPMLIEGNQVVLWASGIQAYGAGKTVRKNQVSLNATGIDAGGTTTVTGNVVSGNGQGVGMTESAKATGNAVYGNSSQGFFAIGLSGTIRENNIFGNDGQANCGVGSNASASLDATHNYWGAPSGPGPDPADQAGASCNFNGTTTTSPFAATPFNVDAPIRP